MKAIFNKMTYVTISNNNDEIRAAIFKNDRTTKKSIGILIKQNDNQYSDLIYYSYSALREKNAENRLNKLKDYGQGITETNVREVAEFFRQDKTFNTITTITDYDDKSPISEVCLGLLSAIGLTDEQIKAGVKPEQLAIIPTTVFNNIVKEYGYKVPLKVKKLFLQSGILAPSDSRKYDYKAHEDDEWSIRVNVFNLIEEVK